MRRLKSATQAQRFLSAFGPIAGHFQPCRHRLRARQYRALLQGRFLVWNEVTRVKQAASFPFASSHFLLSSFFPLFNSAIHCAPPNKLTISDDGAAIRLVVLLFSLPFLLLIVAGGQLLHGGAWGWIVLGAVIGMPVVAINVLVFFSRWHKQPDQSRSTRCPNRFLIRFVGSQDYSGLSVCFAFRNLAAT